MIDQYLQQYIESSIIIDYISVIFLVLISVVIRIILASLNQSWIKTFAHTATLTLLPIVTFVITKVISGNIALSLGMVGALSIVRFRNPVKSPLELVVYFLSITMGIAAAVSKDWLVFLSLSIAIGLFILFSVNYIATNYFKYPYFQASFTEGNHQSYMEVHNTHEIPQLSNSKFISSLSQSVNGYSYILTSPVFQDLQSLRLQILDEYPAVSIQLTR